MKHPRCAPILCAIAAVLLLSGCMVKTVADRVIEARSSADIVKDNEIVLEVNKVMAELGTIKASTEIYEQRLLVTGLFDDQETYDTFRSRVQAVEDVKRLYWHVTYMSEADQELNASQLINWPEALKLDTEVGLDLVGTKGVADVNLRVAVDAFSTVYLLGRARSQQEMEKAVEVASQTEGVKKVVNYVEVRP